ncbi:MAG: DUF4194 domain-containing protein [Candidatus Nanopelagicales bacterium]|jgi:hypothetical protein
MSDPTIADACVPLLRGVVYADTQPAAWNALLALPAQVRDYLSTIGLDVVIDEAEGYAFLQNAATPPEQDDPPRLIARRPLTYRVSLMLVLLRRRLLELDAQGDQTRLIITRDEAVDLVRTYHPTRSNEARLTDDVESDLRRIVELGFARALRDQPHTYEIRRIIKAFVDAQWLADFDERLSGYLAAARQDAS